MINKLDVLGSIMGVVVGDALGVPYEFSWRDDLKKNPAVGMKGYGAHEQPVGTWSDDSSMTLASLDSLKDKLDYKDVMDKYADWYTNAAYTPYDYLFDMGLTTEDAVKRYLNGTKPLLCGGNKEKENGNGSLMRIVPFALYIMKKSNDFHNKLSEALLEIGKASALTHRHIRSQIACGIYSKIFADIKLHKESKPLNDIIAEAFAKAYDCYAHMGRIDVIDELPYFDRILKYNDFLKLPENEINSSGYVIDTIEAALWCLGNTSSYKECILKCVNLGRDTDTVAAVAGGLAGLYYGYDAIPEEWLDVIAKREWIEQMCIDFAGEVESEGKEKCRLMKSIRKEIAEQNGIVYLTYECGYQGDCLGTCSKCDAEIKYLENEIKKKMDAGEQVTVAGVAMNHVDA